MKRYFYHGIESWAEFYGIEAFLAILKGGEIKKRNMGLPKESKSYACLDHICLYRKNEEVDYSDRNIYLKSALAGWIEHGFTFVISPDIEAKYIKPNSEVEEGWGLQTNLIDEWRCRENIPLEKIVGIALPLNALKEYFEEEKTEDWAKEREAEVKKYILEIKSIVERLGIRVANSNVENFTDRLDEELQNEVEHEDQSLEEK